jgi:phage anti-repressor protein
MQIENLPVLGENKLAVNARDLWEFLGVGRDFSNWIKVRIEKYKFVENQDFIVFAKTGENSEGRPQREYHLSTDIFGVKING